MDAIKIAIMALISSILAYFQPIHDIMIVLAFVFVVDFGAGLLVDLIVNDDRIRIKKVLFATIFIALYVSIIASVFFIGDRMGDGKEALSVIKMLTYVFIYFYASNTLRNLCLLFPENKPLAFLYYFLGLQVVKRLPELAIFLGLTKKDNNNENN